MRALVTGASRGIGAELARLLAADGYDLVLVARSAQDLTQLAEELRTRSGVSVRTAPADLSRPGEAARLWEDVVEPDGGGGEPIDVLVNNAGVGMYGPLADADPRVLDDMVQLNVAVVTTLTRLALPGMVQRHWGKILNLASIVGYQPAGPRMAAYYATKAYVLSFSKGLARELRGSGVTVTALSPGLTRTAFEERSGARDTILYRWIPSMSAAAVARAGYRGLMRGRAVVLPGLVAKLLAIAGELPPRRIALEVNRLLLKRLTPEQR